MVDNLGAMKLNSAEAKVEKAMTTIDDDNDVGDDGEGNATWKRKSYDYIYSVISL